MERTLVAGGRLHFWTDVEEYFRTTLELIAATVKLEGPLSVHERPAERDLDYRTHFERRTRKNEQPVYRAEFEKRVRPLAQAMISLAMLPWTSVRRKSRPE